MSVFYGVLRGKLDRWKREDDRSSPHLQIRVVDGNNKAWRVPVNVLSGDGSLVIFHRKDPLTDSPILSGLGQVATGFTPLAEDERRATNSLDYFRSPVFDWPTGVAAPHFVAGDENDLQDTLIAYLAKLKSTGGDLFAFGAKFPEPGQPSNPRPIDTEFGTTQGMHDIHMNQGNPNPGRFADDNGVFHDGGLLLKFPDRVVGLFLRFKTQFLPTDNTTGHRLPGAREIPPGGTPTSGTGTEPILEPVTFPGAYIERALVNPVGDDPGKEIVVIGNTTTSAIDLTGWSIADKNNNAEVLRGVLVPAGESRAVVLSGESAQLTNKGGTIRLLNPAGEQIHAVAYSKQDAGGEGRYLRFNT